MSSKVKIWKSAKVKIWNSAKIDDIEVKKPPETPGWEWGYCPQMKFSTLVGGGGYLTQPRSRRIPLPDGGHPTGNAYLL